MPLPLSDQHKQARPRVLVGIIGSLLTIISFFLLPAYSAAFFGGPVQSRNAWEVWQQLAAVPSPLSQDSAPFLIALTLLPLCALVTLLIECVGLIRPLPRLWLIVFTAAAWMGLGILCCFLALSFIVIPNLGYVGMVSGSICMLVERKALSQARIGTLLLTYSGHDQWINAVTWAPDGRRIASVGQDKTVQIWNAAAGKQSISWHLSHTAEVRAMAWSPDGKHIASASDESTVQVWEARSGNLLNTYQGHTAGVNSVAWSPDGQHIASGSDDQTIHIWGWEAEAGNQVNVYRGHDSAVRAVAWSPSGTRIASGSDDGTVQVWDVLNARRLLIYSGHQHGSGRGSVTSVAWSPDSQRIVSASQNDKTVQVWNSRTKDLLLTYRGHTRVVSDAAWSPNGKRIASASRDGTVQIWDAGTGKTVYTYSWLTSWVRTVAWSPDGTRLALAGEEKTVQVWSAG